jgi:enoyl-CoA hydratase/carnithine racemase
VGGGLEEARVVEAAVRHNPVAATTLAQVLRAGVTLGVGGALTMESLAYSTLQSGPEHRHWLETRRVRAADGRPDPAVRLDRRGDNLWVTLDRPERRNAYSARMRDELVAALEVPAFDPSIRAVHLTGAGPNFCSGGDLAEFGALPDPATAHSIRTQRSAGWRISQLANRVTVHLHGACVGAGIELAAFAGTVEATEDATMALPEVGMGLIPGAGGTASLPRRIGPARTAWLALTGVRLDAPTARRWGLVDRLVASGLDAGTPSGAK